MKKKHIILAIILLSGWFMWFQIRPALARRQCVKKIIKDYQPGKMTSSLANLIYRGCLASWGIKPEPFVTQ